MAQLVRSCDDCGTAVYREKAKGQIPKRCQACRRDKRNAQTRDWHARHPDAQTQYSRARVERRASARGQYVCPVCEQPFTPRRSDSTYCTKPCALAAANAPDLAAARLVLERRTVARDVAEASTLCEWCETEPKRTDPDSGRPARFCSQRCMRAWHSRIRRHIPSRRHAHGNWEHKQRTARLGAVSPGVTWTEWRHVLDFYGHRCAYCGSADRIEQDHLVPVTRGGLHEPGNVVPACRPCNRSKRDQLLEEWLPGLHLQRLTFDLA